LRQLYERRDIAYADDLDFDPRERKTKPSAIGPVALNEPLPDTGERPHIDVGVPPEFKYGQGARPSVAVQQEAARSQEAYMPDEPVSEPVHLETLPPGEPFGADEGRLIVGQVLDENDVERGWPADAPAQGNEVAPPPEREDDAPVVHPPFAPVGDPPKPKPAVPRKRIRERA
jgi:hypothetical protein